MDIEQPFPQKNSETSIPWVEKYRPDNLHDLISHEPILDTCNSILRNSKNFHPGK